MKKESKATLKELIRRERINEHHEPITDVDIENMVSDIFKPERRLKAAKEWFFCLVIVAIAGTIGDYLHYLIGN